MKKEQLTINDIKTDLKMKNRLNYVGLFESLFVFMVVFALSFWAFSMLRNYTIFLVVVFIFPAVVLGLILVQIVDIIKLHIVLVNKICVVKDKVIGFKSNKRSRYRGLRRRHQTHQYLLYFSGFGEYAIVDEHYKWSKMYAMSVESVYNSANCGDEFYLVLTKAHTGKILMIYNCKMFEFKEK